MGNRSFIGRLMNFGVSRMFMSRDFIATLSIFALMILFKPEYLDNINYWFIETSINVSISLTAFIIAAFAILISLSNREFIIFLKKRDIYDKILFLFEWNVYTTITVAAFGLYIGYFERNVTIYRLFIFAFLYMMTSVINLTSFITYYGQRKGEFEVMQDTKNNEKEEKEKEAKKSPSAKLRMMF